MWLFAQIVPFDTPKSMPKDHELATWIVWGTFIVGMTLLLSAFAALMHFIRQQSEDIKAERVANDAENKAQRTAHSIEQEKLRNCHTQVCKEIVASNERMIERHYDVQREATTALVQEIRALRCHGSFSGE